MEKVLELLRRAYNAIEYLDEHPFPGRVELMEIQELKKEIRSIVGDDENHSEHDGV